MQSNPSRATATAAVAEQEQQKYQEEPDGVYTEVSNTSVPKEHFPVDKEFLEQCEMEWNMMSFRISVLEVSQ